MKNNTNILDLVDKYNLTLIKLPSEQSDTRGIPKSDLTRVLADNEFLVEQLIKSGVTEDYYKKIYDGIVGVRFDNGNVYRTFLRTIKTTDEPRWACFANTNLFVSSGMTMNKAIYKGVTAEDAVLQAVDALQNK